MSHKEIASKKDYQKIAAEKTDASTGLGFSIGVMLLIGGIFTLPFGALGIVVGLILMSKK